jgi:hypothetical protein
VLINSIPSGGTFLGLSPVGLPFKDLGSQDPKTVEENLNRTLSGMLARAQQKNISFICLMAQPGDDPVSLYVISALADLPVSRNDTAITVLFYSGGHQSFHPPQYSLSETPTKTALVSQQAKKISVPKGVTTIGWMYFNLSRFQAQAEQAGSKTIFLASSGTGSSSPLIVPGLKETLPAFDDAATFTASWYMDPATAAAHHAPPRP